MEGGETLLLRTKALRCWINRYYYPTGATNERHGDDDDDDAVEDGILSVHTYIIYVLFPSRQWDISSSHYLCHRVLHKVHNRESRCRVLLVWE